MRNARWQLKYFKAMAALLVAAGEAVAQETRPVARRIVVSIPDRKLALVEHGRVVKIYAVAVGAAATPSPAGNFTVIARVSHPTWYGPGKVAPPGKGNRLGPRWIGLSRRGYGIHGTSSPRSIGRPASHGCIRMHNADVEELFGLVEIGDAVELYAERTEEVDRIFGVPAAVQQVASLDVDLCMRGMR
ncbi:MAG TPA: L,D-transpeptidase [Bryobacteraceae bacterium]|nr:L,D-transpeptidase [Bryobacteraceae bacterium]